MLKVQNTNVITSTSSATSNHTQNNTQHVSQTTATTTTTSSHNNSHNNATIEIKQQPQPTTTTIQIQSPNQLANTHQVCLNAMDLNDVDVRTNKNKLFY